MLTIREDAAIFSIEPIEMARGTLPKRAAPLGRSLGRASSIRAFDRLEKATEWSASITYRAAQVKEKIVHEIHRVESFEIVGLYTLLVGFEDDTEQLINFEPVLAGELFGPLRNLSLFNEVRVDPEVHTLVWPNGADFAPATLHDWPKLVNARTAQAKEWESVPA